jgi:hypothetical protein
VTVQNAVGRIFAVIGIAVTTWATGRPPSTTWDFIVYALPGGILGYLFGPLLKLGLEKLFGSGGTNGSTGSA